MKLAYDLAAAQVRLKAEYDLSEAERDTIEANMKWAARQPVQSTNIALAIECR